jgi:C4-dicarboxylate-specific signal transduction histidine kinase
LSTVSAKLPEAAFSGRILSGIGAPRATGRLGRTWFERLARRFPIRWRILAIAVLNSALALVLLFLIWDGAKALSGAWLELRQVRQSEKLLVSLDSEAGRLQSLIHRYFNQPNPIVLAEIIRRREALMSRLRAQASIDPLTAEPAHALIEITERFITGFDDLRAVRSSVSAIYDTDVLRPARDMAGLYAIIDSTTTGTQSLIVPSLGKSREAFNAMLLAANAYYLSISQDAGEEAKRNAEIIERTAPVMIDLADSDLQRHALTALRDRAVAVRRGLGLLTEHFATQERLLREAIDGNAAAMGAATSRLTGTIQERERAAQETFDSTLRAVNAKVAIVALLFLMLVVGVGLVVSRTISRPLGDLREDMEAIVAGDYERRVKGLSSRDEIAEMARSVEVFRQNAIAKREAETALRASKEHAESALSELRDTQTSLIEAEKLAALGSLVAGVAHEVNNPVGISLTVASSLARRCEEFEREVETGPIRRSRLSEFVHGNRDAANQLVTNLHRAGELIQSFKQVAVDRSHADRRSFDLKESIEQIVSSLRPGLRKSQVRLVVDVPPGIMMDSYPGPLGQVVTNLFLNAINHAFPAGETGTISIVARTSGPDQVHIVFRDSGAGMSEDVQRKAFEPFFTTRRGIGGTGLGLHIVYNLITQRLGGRIVLSSMAGAGTTFRINLPRVAPREELPIPAMAMSVGA